MPSPTVPRLSNGVTMPDEFDELYGPFRAAVVFHDKLHAWVEFWEKRTETLRLEVSKQAESGQPADKAGLEALEAEQQKRRQWLQRFRDALLPTLRRAKIPQKLVDDEIGPLHASPHAVKDIFARSADELYPLVSGYYKQAIEPSRASLLKAVSWLDQAILISQKNPPIELPEPVEDRADFLLELIKHKEVERLYRSGGMLAGQRVHSSGGTRTATAGLMHLAGVDVPPRRLYEKHLPPVLRKKAGAPKKGAKVTR